MERKNHTREDNYIRAKKKVEDLKGFYWHLFFYVAVNGFISISKVSSDIAEGVPAWEAFWDMPLFFTWIPWGIGLLIHGIVVFDVFSFVIGKNWEERKIQEMLEEDTNQLKNL